jgi:hypothetical protein
VAHPHREFEVIAEAGHEARQEQQPDGEHAQQEHDHPLPGRACSQAAEIHEES